MVRVRSVIQQKREAKRKLDEIKHNKGKRLDVDILFDNKRVAKFGREISDGLLLRLSTLDPSKITFTEHPGEDPDSAAQSSDETE